MTTPNEPEKIAESIAEGFDELRFDNYDNQQAYLRRRIAEAIRKDRQARGTREDAPIWETEDWRKSPGVKAGENCTNDALAQRDYSVPCKTLSNALIAKPRGYHIWWCVSHSQPLYQCEVSKLEALPAPESKNAIFETTTESNPNWVKEAYENLTAPESPEGVEARVIRAAEAWANCYDDTDEQTNFDEAKEELYAAILALRSRPAPSKAVRDALALILPMAKGYAAEHPVGSNQAYVNQAEAVLASAAPEREEVEKLREELAAAKMESERDYTFRMQAETDVVKLRAELAEAKKDAEREDELKRNALKDKYELIDKVAALEKTLSERNSVPEWKRVEALQAEAQELRAEVEAYKSGASVEILRKEVKELRRDNAKLLEIINALNFRPKSPLDALSYNELQDALKELREENKRLKLVADAAENLCEIMTTCGGIEKWQEAKGRLDAALSLHRAALRSPEGPRLCKCGYYTTGDVCTKCLSPIAPTGTQKGE